MSETITKSIRLERANEIRLEMLEKKYGDLSTTSIFKMLIKDRFEADFETARIVQGPGAVMVYDNQTDQEIARIPTDVYQALNDDLRFRFEHGLVPITDAAMIAALATASRLEEAGD